VTVRKFWGSPTGPATAVPKDFVHSTKKAGIYAKTGRFQAAHRHHEHHAGQSNYVASPGSPLIDGAALEVWVQCEMPV
jgi:hypothetical protein